uniref:Protein kinase domain-containing protein n=1 Tax=Spongospora subterranea TaxID=70186 RepID=A0A0H5QVA4_9EUKA|eukprot:CRZ05526.1 hypothetical protein [Spongospora subterranea]
MRRRYCRESTILGSCIYLERFKILNLCFLSYEDFVLELASGGELFQQIRRLKRCPENLAAFYCAEILLILEYLHGQKIIHRDLKPENLLLSQDGHIRLIDFGSAKIIDADDTVKDTSNRRNSFVGTAEYLPPELLNNGDVSFGADWWSFGCVIYQLLSGRPPFKGETEYLTFQKIIEHKIVFDDHLSTAAISLLTKLLNVDPQDRVSGGFDRLKQHPFFRDIAFDDLFNSEVPSYFVDVNSNEPQQEADAAIILPNSDSVNSMALANADSDCSGFLTNSEVALMLGIITERKGLFFKKKMLILTSAPRLFHISLGKKQQQTEIPWSASLRASIYKGNAFLIYTPEKLFRFQTVDLTAQAWVDAIEEAHKRGS